MSENNYVIRKVKLLYPANTNIDYFPTNFVVHDGVVFYIDYECNDYMQEWDFVKYWQEHSEIKD